MKLMDRQRMIELLDALSARLERRRVQAKLYVFGGATMLLAYGRTESTRDLDVRIDEGQAATMEAVREIAREEGLDEGWLNEQGVACIPAVPDSAGTVLYQSRSLTVAGASREFMLAMKLEAARPRDEDDIRLLLEGLKIGKVEDAVAVHARLLPESKKSDAARKAAAQGLKAIAERRHPASAQAQARAKAIEQLEQRMRAPEPALRTLPPDWTLPQAYDAMLTLRRAGRADILAMGARALDHTDSGAIAAAAESADPDVQRFVQSVDKMLRRRKEGPASPAGATQEAKLAEALGAAVELTLAEDDEIEALATEGPDIHEAIGEWARTVAADGTWTVGAAGAIVQTSPHGETRSLTQAIEAWAGPEHRLAANVLGRAASTPARCPQGSAPRAARAALLVDGLDRPDQESAERCIGHLEKADEHLRADAQEGDRPSRQGQEAVRRMLDQAGRDQRAIRLPARAEIATLLRTLADPGVRMGPKSPTVERALLDANRARQETEDARANVRG